MDDYVGRSRGNIPRQNDEPTFVIPLSAPFTGSRLQRVFNSIQPFVNQSPDIPFRNYARRFFPQNSLSSLNPRLVGRGSLVRPQIVNTSMGQSIVSNLSTSNTSPSVVPVSPSSSVPAVDNAPDGVQNVVINIELDPYNQRGSSGDTAERNNSRATQNNSNEGLNSIGTSLSIDTQPIEEFIGRNQDLRISVMNFWPYLVFIFTVLLKLLLDKITSIFIIVCLCIIFVMGDKVVRKKASFQNRSFKSVFAGIFIMPLSIYVLYRTEDKENFIYSAILLFPDYNLLSLGDLLWIVTISDLVVKIVTVMMKSIVVLLPRSIIHQHLKANTYALLERISRLYLSLVTIQPWLSYFLDGYNGPRKVFGVFLSVFYMLCKCPEILIRIKDLRNIIIKIIFSTRCGSNPTQSEVDDAGGRCPICHDEFNCPLRLVCSHIFCETCVLTWFTKEKTCPMCRTNIMTEDPAYRDGSTSYLPQIY